MQGPAGSEQEGGAGAADIQAGFVNVLLLLIFGNVQSKRFKHVSAVTLPEEEY